jgi:uncharacterized OB-fold protein
LKLTEDQVPFTIESFYNFIKERKIMGVKCNQCGKMLVPPKPMCPQCFSKDLGWKELSKRATLLTYTVIHVSPEMFRSLAPYAVGIVELDSGAQLPGMIKNVDLSKIKVGMKLVVDFDTQQITEDWPQWPRYYFKPLNPE